jgi:PAS domain S-box-containing protein
VVDQLSPAQPADEAWPGQTLADHMNDYIMRYDRAHRHIFANRAAIEVTGLPREEYIGRTHREMGFPEDLCALWEHGIDAAFETGQPQSAVFQWQSAGGLVVLDWRVVPEYEQGQIVSVLAVSRDITALALSQETTRAQQAELDAIYENAPLAMLLVDREGRVRRANRYARALTVDNGGDSGRVCVCALLGCLWDPPGSAGWGSVPECDTCVVRHAVRETLNTGTAHEQIEASLPFNVDGQRRDVHFVVSSTPVTIGDEHLALVNMLDITLRVQAEAALRTSQALMSETQRLASVGGWQLDVATGRTLWTDQIYVLHEVPVGPSPELLDALSFYPEPDRAILEGAVKRAIETGTPYDLELRFVTAAGRPLYVRTIGNPEREDGRVVRVVGAFQDVTARKQAELDLAQSRRELEVRVEERTRELSERNAELLALSDTERRLRQTAETLAAASASLAVSLDVDGRLQTLFDYLSTSVPCDRISVLLPVDETHFVVRAVRDMHATADPHPLLGTTIDVQSSPAFRRLAATRKAVLLQDLDESSMRHPLGTDEMRSWLGIPLVASGRVIGVCSMNSVDTVGFDADSVRLAEALVEQAATAVQNAWLFEQVRAGRERLEGVARRLVEVQESERKYIARELHDEAAQALAALMMGLRMLDREADRPEAVRAGVAELLNVAENVLEELRRLAMDLRPASLDYVGLPSALQQHLESIGERHGPTVRLRTVGFEERLIPDTETALYRIVQEAVANVVRHANAGSIDVLLERRGNRIEVTVADDGVGFEPEALPQSGRLGLLGMQERADILGGTLSIDSRPGAGTTVRLEIPYGDTGADR